MKKVRWIAIIVLCCPPLFAMKNRQRAFVEPCDVVWKAAVTVAKTQDYRVVSIAEKEQILSFIAGGAWSGERIITLSLAPGAERGCIATVQSRFSGLAHSDGPDLLARIGVELIAETADRDSKAFQHFKRCIDGYNASDEKCEAKFRKETAAAATQTKTVDPSKEWWNQTSTTEKKP